MCFGKLLNSQPFQCLIFWIILSKILRIPKPLCRELIIERNGHRFLLGDLNVKYVHWRSILTTTKDREPLAAIGELACDTVCIGNPTYWSADTNKISDFLDFYITRNILTCGRRIRYELRSLTHCYGLK